MVMCVHFVLGGGGKGAGINVYIYWTWFVIL